MFEQKTLKEHKQHKKELMFLLGAVIGWLSAYLVNYLYGQLYFQYLVAAGVVVLIIICLLYAREPKNA
jgi:uncharacterized membrane protein YgaE (UPF0421/DUF939 family)